MGKDTVLEYVHIVCLVNTPNTTIYDTIFHARTLPDLSDTFQPFDHQQHNYFPFSDNGSFQNIKSYTCFVCIHLIVHLITNKQFKKLEYTCWIYEMTLYEPPTQHDLVMLHVMFKLGIRIMRMLSNQIRSENFIIHFNFVPLRTLFAF